MSEIVRDLVDETLKIKTELISLQYKIGVHLKNLEKKIKKLEGK